MSGASEPPQSLDAEALTLAMILAPSAYSRNKLFGLFREERVGRSRSRARMIRSLAVELARTKDATIEMRPVASGRVHLTLRVESLQYTHNVELSQSELSALKWLCSRANVSALTCDPEDQKMVEHILRRLVSGLIS